MQELQDKINDLQAENQALQIRIRELINDKQTLQHQSMRIARNNMAIRISNYELKKEHDKYKAMFEWVINKISYSRSCPSVDCHVTFQDCDNDESTIKSCRECWIEAARKAVEKEGE